MSLAERLSTPEGKGRYVRSLFATIADRYDLITRLLSYGQDRRWKLRLVGRLGTLSGRRALDLATGTGDIAWLMQRRGARVVGLDLTPRMIALARRDGERGSPSFLVGDMMTLPFAADSFDIVTTGYGLRNVTHLAAAVDEMHRVLRAGGEAISLDFNRPANRVVRALYLVYLEVTGAVLGWMLHRDAETYRYIPASIRRYPGADAVAALFAARGFRDVRHVPVLGGLMAIHHARK
jgi:demethylmenaquinone methyltransferase/2-methoxy-6-polyprenyl-1,4-benzoquinol methylase